MSRKLKFIALLIMFAPLASIALWDWSEVKVSDFYRLKGVIPLTVVTEWTPLGNSRVVCVTIRDRSIECFPKVIEGE